MSFNIDAQNQLKQNIALKASFKMKRFQEDIPEFIHYQAPYMSEALEWRTCSAYEMEELKTKIHTQAQFDILKLIGVTLLSTLIVITSVFYLFN